MEGRFYLIVVGSNWKFSWILGRGKGTRVPDQAVNVRSNRLRLILGRLLKKRAGKATTGKKKEATTRVEEVNCQSVIILILFYFYKSTSEIILIFRCVKIDLIDFELIY
jgi:hypothetical protein